MGGCEGKGRAGLGGLDWVGKCRRDAEEGERSKTCLREKHTQSKQASNCT